MKFENTIFDVKVKKKDTTLLLTPFIDVIFLLTLFFVLNTSFEQFNVFDVTLPEADTGESLQHESLTITFDETGNLYLNAIPSSLDTLDSDLAELIASSPTIISATIVADKTSSYDTIIYIINTLKRNEISNFGLGIEQSSSN